MPSFDQDKKTKFLLIALFVVSLVLVVYFAFLAAQTNVPGTDLSQRESQGLSTIKAELIVKPQFNTASLHDDADFEIKMDSGGEFIKGVAFRLVFPYEGEPPFEIEERPFDLMDVPVEEGWIVAVNTLKDTGTEVVADFSAINTAPEGFVISSEAAFAMFRVHTGSTQVSDGVIQVDTIPSQLATNDGEAMLFNTTTETYTIK